MFRKAPTLSKVLVLTMMSAVAATATIAVPTAASAQYYAAPSYGYDRGEAERDGYYQQARNYRDGRGYGRGGYDRGDRRDYRDADYRRGNGRNYRYNDGRCRDKGTGGTIIGAIAGGLLGNAVVGRHGDNTAGTIVGAGVGALAGRSIDRSDGRPC